MTVTVEEATRLRAAITRISKTLRATPSGQGLSPTALDTLGTVVRRGPIGMSELATLDSLNPTMLSRLAAQLEAAGFVQRLPGPADGRSVSVEATETGRALYGRILAERLDVLRRATDLLDAQDRAALVAALPALEHVADTLRPRSARPQHASEPARQGASR
jgi:DNA-binding MarR family transcriptional regulator